MKTNGRRTIVIASSTNPFDGSMACNSYFQLLEDPSAERGSNKTVSSFNTMERLLIIF